MAMAPIERLLGHFELFDGYTRVNGRILRLYRIFPPNLSIMTSTEVRDEIETLAQLFDTLRKPLTLFATDKTEDLSDIRAFYESLDQSYDYLTTDILEEITSSEARGASVQRAFYIIYEAKTLDDDIESMLTTKGYRAAKASAEETASLLRNYLLREFNLSRGLYTLDTELPVSPKLRKAREALWRKEVVGRIVPQRINFAQLWAQQSGGFKRRTVMVKNFPQQIIDACLLDFATMPGTTLTIRLDPMNEATTRNMVDKQVNNKKMIFSRKRVTELIDKKQDEESLVEAYRELANTKNAFFRINVFIEYYGRDEDEFRATEDKVLSALVARGISLEKLAFEQREGFLSVWPFGRDLFANSCNNMPSTSVAALYPMSHSCRLDRQGMLLGTTDAGGQMYLDIWHVDDHKTNYNWAIIGESGQGKSYLMKKIIVFQTIRGIRIWILDPEDEYVKLTRRLGGTVLNCASSEFRINPFHVRMIRRADDLDDDIDAPVKVNMPMFYQHLSWLSDFFRVLLPGLSSAERKALDIFIRGTYAERSINEHTDFNQLSPEDYPIFSDLYAYIEKHRNDNQSLITEDIARNLLLHLNDCVEGFLGHVLNGATKIPNDRMICFSLAELLDGAEERKRAVLFNLTTYIWNEVCVGREPSALCLDEVYLYLDRKDPTMAIYLKFFVKRARKYNAALGIATQQLEDCFQDELEAHTTALFNNAATKFIFHPGKIDMDLAKSKLKLRDGWVSKISRSRRRHCLVTVGDAAYYLTVGTLPYEENLFGSAGGR